MRGADPSQETEAPGRADQWLFARLSLGNALVAAGVVVALAVAGLATVLLPGHRASNQPVSTSSPPFPGNSAPTLWQLRARFVSVDGNLAAARLADAPPTVPEKVVWSGRRGQMLRSFIAGGPKAVLDANAIGEARFGARLSEVVARLSRLLGPPATTLSASACGPVQTISWRQLTAYFRSGRFIGYAYGYQTPRRLPGPVLATARGLTLGDTIARARRLYGSAFRSTEEQGGSWLLTTAGGTLEGFAYTEVPLRHGDTGPRRMIATIQAGPRICAALSP